MSVVFRSKNGMVLGVIESPSGTEGTPTPASNAIKVREGWTWTPDFEVIETDEVRASLDQSEPIIGRGMGRMQLGAFLKGADTAGTAPEAGPFYRASGLSQTLTAADITGTAAAGAASTITLDSYASSTNDIYNGMVITTDDGDVRVITDYVGATKVATVVPAWDNQPDGTTDYTIHASALYEPVSTGLETITLFGYDLHSDGASNAKLRKLIGGMNSWKLSLQAGGLGELTFDFMGQIPSLPADVSKPTAPTYQAARAYPFINAQVYLGGVAVKLSAFDLDLGFDVNAFDDPSAAYGYDLFQGTNRQISGNFTADLTLNSVRNTVSDFVGSTSRSLWLRWGTVAGSRFSLWIPEMRYTGNTMGDLRGFRTEQIPFRAPVADAGIALCIY